LCFGQDREARYITNGNANPNGHVVSNIGVVNGLPSQQIGVAVVPPIPNFKPYGAGRPVRFLTENYLQQ